MECSYRYANPNGRLWCTVISFSVCVVVLLIVSIVVFHQGFRKCDENLNRAKTSLQLYENTVIEPLRLQLNQKKTELERKKNELSLPRLKLEECDDNLASLEIANKQTKEKTDSDRKKLITAKEKLAKKEKELKDVESEIKKTEDQLLECENSNKIVEEKIRDCVDETHNLNVAEKTSDLQTKTDDLNSLNSKLTTCESEESMLEEKLKEMREDLLFKRGLLEKINSLLYPGQFTVNISEIIENVTLKGYRNSEYLVMVKAEIFPFKGNLSMTMGALFDSVNYNESFKNDRPLGQKRNETNLILGSLLSALLSLKEFPTRNTFLELLHDTGDRLQKLLLLRYVEPIKDHTNSKGPTFDVRKRKDLKKLCVDSVIAIGLNTLDGIFYCCIKSEPKK